MGTDTTDVNRLESEENAIHTDAYAAQVRSNVNRFVCSITVNFEYQNKLFVFMHLYVFDIDHEFGCS